uniref:Uncharacterized protein n=1 Tax=Cacopsylla melanoneura TaxID=428564 RepID=A0A8D9E839_9HEMI
MKTSTRNYFSRTILSLQKHQSFFSRPDPNNFVFSLSLILVFPILPEYQIGPLVLFEKSRLHKFRFCTTKTISYPFSPFQFLPNSIQFIDFSFIVFYPSSVP